MSELHLDPAVRTLGRVDPALSEDARREMRAMRLLDEDGNLRALPPRRTRVPHPAITSHDVLNEAYAYALPSSFSRGVKVTLQPGQRVLWLSGTASIDDQGRTLYPGDFRAQLWRTYHNLTRLLESEGATWHDMVRTTCYLRDIERDYDVFNIDRTQFFRCLGLDPLPASTGIQARLCRSDLLIEIEAFAVLPPAPNA